MNELEELIERERAKAIKSMKQEEARYRYELIVSWGKRIIIIAIILFLGLVLVNWSREEYKKDELTCNKVVVFTDSKAEAELNIKTNFTKPVQTTITVKETGEVVYKSKLIRLFDGVYSDKLATDLEPGSYKCEVVLYGWDEEGNKNALATRDMVIVIEE